MRLVDEIAMYWRLARRLRRYVGERDTVEQGLARLQERMERRESNFLTTAEHAIYGHPGSPFLPLLRQAGCELGDLRRMVHDEGLEPALRKLRAEGVYVRFEESKGRAPIVRGRLEYPVTPADFDNPAGRKDLESSTSGSTGDRTRNPVDFDFSAAQGPIKMLIQSRQGILGLPSAHIRGRLPESSGFGGALGASRRGETPERWFAPVLEPPRRTELRFVLAHHFVVALLRLHGVAVRKPEPFRMDEVGRIARWAADTVAARGGCMVNCTPSMALRISLAAREQGIDLAGVVFRAAGEAMTPAKMAGIRAAGARAVVDYAMSGMGGVGVGCLRPIGVNDQHLQTHHLAIIQAPRRVADREVGALLFTTLLPNAPRVFLNLESDDYGVLEERRCGCPLDDLGLHTHVRDVRSFKKLTAEGITLVGSEMEHVLESVLPARFGGSPLDYQLAEEEDERGFTRVCINVSPRVRLDDEQALIDAVLEGLEQASISADLAMRLWNQAGAIRVRRVEPTLGGSAKLHPLHFSTAPARSAE
jgi:hypothetical protein